MVYCGVGRPSAAMVCVDVVMMELCCRLGQAKAQKGWL